VKHLDAPAHTRGTAPYVDDLPEPAGLLHATVYASPIAHGRIRSLDTARALELDGVVAVLTAADIPGENQIGAIIPDEPLLAEDGVDFIGQPVALVVAETRHEARLGAAAVDADFDQLPAIFDPRAAATAGQLIAPSRTIDCGDVDAAWSRCDVVVEGRADTGGQEHLYLETQGAVALHRDRPPYSGSPLASSACR
jgi:xanthine dehydrogenase large subunit